MPSEEADEDVELKLCDVVSVEVDGTNAVTGGRIQFGSEEVGASLTLISNSEYAGMRRNDLAKPQLYRPESDSVRFLMLTFRTVYDAG